MMAIISSANVACGFHAGDPVVIKETLRAAKSAEVSVGAHPSYPDLQGFGRRPMHMADHEVEAMVAYQIGALMGLARTEDSSVTHVKPHGALNNMAAIDDKLADAVARGIAAVDENLILLAPAGSSLSAAGRRSRLQVAEEIFADRAYADDGQLVSRKLPGAMIHDPEKSVEQVLRFIDAQGIVTQNGNLIPTPIHSICVHGDTPESLAIATAIRRELEANGIKVAPLPELF